MAGNVVMFIPLNILFQAGIVSPFWVYHQLQAFALSSVMLGKVSVIGPATSVAIFGHRNLVVKPSKHTPAHRGDLPAVRLYTFLKVHYHEPPVCRSLSSTCII